MKGWLLAACASVLTAGCFDPQIADCALRCADDAACPAGQVCLAEGLCASPELSSCSAAPGPREVDIACEDETTCALIGGRITCWGTNDLGQIPGTEGMGPVRLPDSFGGETPVALDGGLDHFCTITDAGNLYCWGHAGGNRTGTGTGAIARLELSGVDGVAGGHSYGCALAAGVLHCWGDPECDEISASPRPAPAGESGLRTVIAGDAFLCVADEGQVRCRGQNDHQQCGVVDTPPALCSDDETLATADWSVVLEAAVTGGSGADHHACAIVDGGAVVCWGDASNGRLGTGSTEGISAPVRVSLPCEVRAVAAGYAHTCAVCRSGGEVYCWGNNEDGAVGPEPGETVATPAAVPLPPAVDVCAGETHSCAVTAAGEVYCWGNNENGQLGPEVASEGSATPVAIPLP